MDFSDAPQIGVWASDRDCYELIAEHCRPGFRTLETGSGLSTVLFTALATTHTCVTPAQEEVDRITAYCTAQGIDTSALRFAIGCSDDVLPGLRGNFDVFLVDGNHGFPTPILDWYYGGSLLVDGGLLIVDDLQLPAVAELRRFLDRDPRWTPVRRSPKWAAWRRVGSGSLCQDWFDQPHYAEVRPLHRRALGKVRRGYRMLRRRSATDPA